MRRLTLSEAAQIAEIVAALAVVVSLIYVGLQLQANTAAVRSASVQAITSTTASVLQLLSSNPELTRIRRVGDLNPDALDYDEAYQYRVFYRNFWLNHQNTFFQRRLGVIDEDVWAVYQRIICDVMARPGARLKWSDHSSVLDPEFVALAENCDE